MFWPIIADLLRAMKVDSRILILASTILAGVCDSDNTSSDEFSEDSYWTRVCEKARRHHMGITIVADTAFQNAQAATGYDQHLYLQTFVDTEMLQARAPCSRAHHGGTSSRAVNLYFAELRCSNVKLVLIGVVNVTAGDESTFQIFKNTTRSSGKTLDAHLTLGLFREWANNQSFFNNSDVVYLITSHPVSDFLLAYRLEVKAASYAYGVCSRRRVALGSDDGKTFSGVPAAVQQIANLLGFKWDD
uniref:Putative metalloprotease n=1 Tax=Ixodes ricinus TaxID=34613 RepID=A0A0K8R2T5_IXORI